MHQFLCQRSPVSAALLHPVLPSQQLVGVAAGLMALHPMPTLAQALVMAASPGLCATRSVLHGLPGRSLRGHPRDPAIRTQPSCTRAQGPGNHASAPQQPSHFHHKTCPSSGGGYRVCPSAAWQRWGSPRGKPPGNTSEGTPAWQDEPRGGCEQPSGTAGKLGKINFSCCYAWSKHFPFAHPSLKSIIIWLWTHKTRVPGSLTCPQHHPGYKPELPCGQRGHCARRKMLLRKAPGSRGLHSVDVRPAVPAAAARRRPGFFIWGG